MPKGQKIQKNRLKISLKINLKGILIKKEKKGGSRPKGRKKYRKIPQKTAPKCQKMKSQTP